MATDVQTRRHYSRDLKERIVWQRKALEKKPADIANELDVPLRVVQRVLQLWNEVGDVVRNPIEYRPQGRPRLLNDLACNVRRVSLGLLNSHSRLAQVPVEAYRRET